VISDFLIFLEGDMAHNPQNIVAFPAARLPS
jgi:hypothetical protein